LQVLALLTGGEGSHNCVRPLFLGSSLLLILLFEQHHAFPHDFAAGPDPWNWDPSKWIILGLNRLGLVTGLRRARESDMKEALKYMHFKDTHGVPPSEEDTPWEGETWDLAQALEYIKSKQGSCVVVIDDHFLDVGSYLGEHVSLIDSLYVLGR
jgi:stearoyl-CoA desaturase (delta-9 desaturase)